MSLDSVVSAIGKPYWLDYTELVLRARTGWAPTKSESKTIIERFANELVAHHEGRATNWAVLGLCLDADRFISAMKKQGHLRVSRRGYSDRTIQRVVKALSTASLPVTLAISGYLKSVALLHELGSEVKKIHDDLTKLFLPLKHSGLKGTLASADLLFMLYQTRGLPYDKSLGSDHPQFYGPEELVEGFSFLFFTHVEVFGWPVHNSVLDPGAVRGGTYMALLQIAALIRQFHEMEILIDGLGYALEKKKHGEYLLKPPSREFERAYRYGFIQSMSQAALTFYAHSDSGRPSLKDAVEKLGETFKPRFFKFVKEPVERFTCEFFVEGPVIELLNDPGLFQDEEAFLDQACRELMAQPDDLLGFELADGFTVQDFAPAQRFFNYIRWHMAAYLRPELAARPGVVVQSLVPHITDKKFEMLIEQAIGAGKVRPLLDLLVWREDSERVFDVQYQPVLRTVNGYLVPLNLLGGSNLLRNLLQLTRRRLYEDGNNDPVPQELKKVFLVRTPLAETSVRFSRGGQAVEIDVLVLWGSILFALECKNSLLPVGPHELRTSYDYIHTANEQLDRFRSVFTDAAYRTELAAALKQRTGVTWAIDSSTRLVTCIVMANRMFMGYRIGQNAVRGSFELAHFVEEGTHAMGDETKCFWASSTMTVEDLRGFIEDDTVYRLTWAAMEEYEEEYKFGRCRVVLASFRMWPRRLAEVMGFPKAAAAIAEIEAKEYEKRRQAEAEFRLAVGERTLLQRQSQ